MPEAIVLAAFVGVAATSLGAASSSSPTATSTATAPAAATPSPPLLLRRIVCVTDYGSNLVRLIEQ